jgi:hypothetical protein
LDNGTLPVDSAIYFDLDERGNARVHPDSFTFWHDVAHFVITGFQPLDLVQVFRANYLTPKIIDALCGQLGTQQIAASETAASETAIPGFRGVVTEWGPTNAGHTAVNAAALVETPGTSNYLFESEPGPKAEEALRITKSLIKLANDYAAAKGMTFRLVTLPVFPKAFYQEYRDKPWEPNIDTYDLFQPDRELQAFAEKEGIPFLSAGQFMYNQGLNSAQIETFYFLEGTGHLTPAGHQFLAGAIYACFYDNEKNLTDGKIRRDAFELSACVN